MAARNPPIRWLQALDQVTPYGPCRRLWTSMALLVPAGILLTLLVILPVAYGVGLGFTELRLNRPDLASGFVGLAHYRRMLEDETLRTAAVNTLVWVVGCAGCELLLGMASALVFTTGLPGLRLLSILVFLPWFLPNVVVGNMWALLLDPRLGVVNDLLMRLGLLSSNVAWLADPSTAMMTAIFVQVWHGFPFFTLLLMAGLKAIPPELYEAAAMDGAGMLARFRHVTLPLLRNVILILIAVRVIALVSSPEILLILTHGGPAHSTTVFSVYVYQVAYKGFDFGYGAALSTMIVVLLLPLSYLCVRASAAGRGV